MFVTKTTVTALFQPEDHIPFISVLAQNANRFGPKCKPLWPKMQIVLAQNAKHCCPKQTTIVVIMKSCSLILWSFNFLFVTLPLETANLLRLGNKNKWIYFALLSTIRNFAAK